MKDSKNRKKIMILGASYSQIPLMRAARRLGFTVIAASIPGNYLGFGEADEIAYVDITDPEAVYEAAREREISGIATCCMDVGTRSLGYVCEKMGLPGPSYRGACACTDKSLQKKAYTEAGVNTARYFQVSGEAQLEEALDNLRLPVMVKAVDLMGSRGIFRCDTRQEARENFRRSMEATGKDYCLVEEFLQGTMFGVEAMVSRGELVYVLPLGNDLKKGNPPFPVGHYVPWEHEQELGQKVREQAQRVVTALGFDNCPVDMDCMLLNGEVYIIEATARAGATCIADTVGIYYGIDYYEAIVRVAMGMDVKDLFQRPDIPRRPSITRLLAADEAGIVERICVPPILPEEVVDLSFNIQAGSAVQPMENGRDRIGQLIIKGDTLEECRARQAELLGKIRLEIKPSGTE